MPRRLGGFRTQTCRPRRGSRNPCRADGAAGCCARLAALGGLPTPPSSSCFRAPPIVGRMPDPALFRPDPAEVERLLEVPLTALCVQSVWEERAPLDVSGRSPSSPHFTVRGDVISGLTGDITWNFVGALPGP